MRPRLTALVAWCLLGTAAVAAVLPLYWMATGSLKRQSDAMKTPPEWFPEDPTLANYEKLFGGQEGGSPRSPPWRTTRSSSAARKGGC